jgi:hypothetical protein
LNYEGISQCLAIIEYHFNRSWEQTCTAEELEEEYMNDESVIPCYQYITIDGVQYSSWTEDLIPKFIKTRTATLTPIAQNLFFATNVIRLFLDPKNIQFPPFWL